MLSLLSLIIASGTVLRADTELWEPSTYPDPRTNYTNCNVPHDGTLCDPDHILTDTWRQKILENVKKRMNDLKNAKVQYVSNASSECNSNYTEPVQLFIILAKRIHTGSNQSITSNDLTQFGHGIRKAFGLEEMPCKNYVLVLGVELAKQIYLWTGSDLSVPKEQLDQSLAQYKNLFTERNYMEGLNKIVDEITSLLTDPFKEFQTSSIPNETTIDMLEVKEETSTFGDTHTKMQVPSWMYTVIIICVFITFGTIIFLLILFFKYFKQLPISIHTENTIRNKSKSTIVVVRKEEQNLADSGKNVTPEISNCRNDCNPTNSFYQNATPCFDNEQLKTDFVVVRRNSDYVHHPAHNNFSSL